MHRYYGHHARPVVYEPEICSPLAMFLDATMTMVMSSVKVWWVLAKQSWDIMAHRGYSPRTRHSRRVPEQQQIITTHDPSTMAHNHYNAIPHTPSPSCHVISGPGTCSDESILVMLQVLSIT